LKLKKSKQTAKILSVLGLISLILGLSLVSLVVADIKPLDLFYSQNNLYVADLTPTQATIGPNVAQTFSIIVESASTRTPVDTSSHTVTYAWSEGQTTIPLTGSAIILFGEAPGTMPIQCIVTVDGTTTINCYATLTVTGTGEAIPESTPLQTQIISLLSVDRMLFAGLGSMFAAIGSVALVLSRRF